MQIGSVPIDPPFGLAPMAGLTDSAFRRLVKRAGGCGLVVSEMVSAEGVVRGVDRTLEYVEYTEEERPVAIQIFGVDPARMAAAARVVEESGADIVDVNMGCPVPKIVKHGAGCRLMREPERAASIVTAMARAVKIPVTVKMRAGWDEREVNAPELAKVVEQAGAAAVAVHGRTARQSYSGSSDWELIARVAAGVRIPVIGCGDCVEASQLVDRVRSGIGGVLVGRGALRNPWIFRQAADLRAGRAVTAPTLAERGRFLLDYIDLLLRERVNEADGFRHVVPGSAPARPRGRERWVINKLRALGSWYTKGLEGGSRLRVAINSAESIGGLREVIGEFFGRQTPRESDRDAAAMW